MAMVTTSRAGASSVPLITHKVSTVSQVSRKPFQTDTKVSQNGKTPTEKTNTNHTLKAEKTTFLFSVKPFVEAKTTGTPTTKANDTRIKANNAS